MRILLIHQFFLDATDGGGSRFNEMTKVWREEGHEIVVLAGTVHYASGLKAEKYKGKYFIHERLDNGVEIIRCFVSDKYNANFLWRLWAYFSFMFSALYGGLFKTKGKFDIILVSSPPLFVGLTAYWLSLFKRIPYLFEVRDLWPESAIDTGVLKNKWIIKLSYWLEKKIYKHASKINVLTPAFKQTLIEKKKIDTNKICFIPNAADFTIAEKCAEKLDVMEFRQKRNWQNKFIVVYVGAHGVANHLIQLVDTASLLADDPDILILSIGSGMEKAHLEEEVKKRGLTNILFLPPVSKNEVFEYILMADIGTSVLKKVDTFKTIYSNKTFDYMASKKPILMAIDGVSKELVEQAQAGCFVEPENPNDFATKIKYYKANPSLVKTQGENGYKFAKEHFDRKVLAKKYIDEMQDMLGKD